jgi:tetratricopeptide (TPR) repeat protein
MASDPLRTDAPAPANSSPGVERDAKIEQLLLAGLDHYFASQYEQAINIWTRALFFDRNHARARAYIERARRAQAERQRESEELLHNGAVAYRRGDGREARRLLQAALDAGAPFEDTFPMLERLNQLEAATSPPAVPNARHLAHAPASAAADHVRARSKPALAAGAALLLMVAGGTYIVVSSRGEWRPWSALAGGRGTPTSAPTVREVAFSVPTAGEMALASAKRRMSRGDLHAALATLERVRPTDPMKREADRLRTDIQRELLRSATDGSPDSAAGESGAEPREMKTK